MIPPHPMFGPSALAELAERTEYEAWFLEAVYAIVEQKLFPSWPDGVVYPVDNSKARFIAHMAGNIVVGDWRPGFLNAGAPLIFVSTFKVLDMLIEWILEANGVSPTFRFQEKLRHLRGSPIFPPLIESRPWLKERLIGLYSTLDPLRGTIIHDKQFTATDGAIWVTSSRKGARGLAVDISADHLRKLALTIVSVLRYVDGTWQLNEFREKFVRYDLDQLVALHGLPLLGQMRPYHTCVRVYLSGSDPFRVDPVAIRGDVAARYVDQDCSFDLRILVVKDGEVVDAFLFPWSLIASANAGWGHQIDIKRYRVAIPDDIDRAHLT